MARASEKPLFRRNTKNLALCLHVNKPLSTQLNH
jgi:hypothetical protein